MFENDDILVITHANQTQTTASGNLYKLEISIAVFYSLVFLLLLVYFNCGMVGIITFCLVIGAFKKSQ